MEDEDLLLRIKNLSSALNNLSDSDEELFAENVPEREDITEAEKKEEALENKLREVIEEFFDLCDDDKDGYIFDDDAEIFRDRIRVHPKESFRPMLLWLKSMPHNTIRNTSRAMFIEDVFAAFDQCHPNDPEKSISIVNSLIKMVRESIELEKKESNQGHSDHEYEQYSDSESYANDRDYSREVDVEPTAETTKADPGMEVISKTEKKKDPTRSKKSMPEKELYWQPEKKAFKAKKRKRKNASKITPVAPVMQERNAGPRDIGVDTDYKPYVAKPQKLKIKHKRAKTAPSLKRDPPASMPLPQTRAKKAPRYHAKSMGEVYEKRGLKKSNDLELSHFRARSLGPREIGLARGYKPASYDWSSSLPGTLDQIYPPRIPKARLIQESERPRKTGPREETYPEGWRPPPKEWENTLWRPFLWHLSTSSSSSRSRPKKTKVRRAQTVSVFNSEFKERKTRKKDPVKHDRSKTVDFNLGAFSTEPIVIQRKKKKVQTEEPEAGAEPVSLKPRERANLEDVFPNDLTDMASDNVEDDGEETSI